jgi:predicted DNA-binding ribbon-helix-helix protein
MRGEIKRSVTIAGHRTSISLEPEFWDALKSIATHDRVSLSQLVARIDSSRAGAARRIGLSSAIRVFVLDHFRTAAK